MKPLVLPAFWPLISMSGVPVYPGCVVPSITTGCVIAGNTFRNVGEIVWTPAPGILNVMTSGGPPSLLAIVIASLSEPGPVLLVFVTNSVLATAIEFVWNTEVLFLGSESPDEEVTPARLLVVPPAITTPVTWMSTVAPLANAPT
jgi:hypothetical protein